MKEKGQKTDKLDKRAAALRDNLRKRKAVSKPLSTENNRNNANKSKE